MTGFMEHRLDWLNEEEGTITFFEDEIPEFAVRFFVTGDGEAEFRIQDIVFSEDCTGNAGMQEKVTLKMRYCIPKSFLLLWNEGFEEVVLIEQAGTETAKILDSTGVVRLAYSEYMMKRCLESQKSTDCGRTPLKLTKERDGYSCENTEKTFFCRLMSYSAESPGKPCFYLYEVEVNKKNRNKGIATACLTELFRLLAAEAPVVIYLQVGSYNEPAVHLYEKLGFEISEELRYYAMDEE